MIFKKVKPVKNVKPKKLRSLDSAMKALVCTMAAMCFCSCLFPHTPRKKIYTYKVVYMLQDFDETKYLECGSEKIEGEAGEMTAAVPKDFEGFTVQDFSQLEISEDNSTVVEIFYNRNPVEITFHANGGTFVPENSSDITRTLKYGEKIVPPEVKRNGYSVKWPEFERAGVNGKTDYTAQWVSTNPELKDKYFYLVAAHDGGGADVFSEFSTRNKTFVYIYSKDHEFDSRTVRAEDNPTWFKFYHKDSDGNNRPGEYESLCGSCVIDSGKLSIRANFYGQIVQISYTQDARELRMTIPCEMLKSAAQTFPFGKDGTFTLVFRAG